MKKYNVYGIMAAALVGACALVGCAKDSDVSGTDVTGNADISGSQASDAADESKAEQTDGEAGIQRLREPRVLIMRQQMRTKWSLH